MRNPILGLAALLALGAMPALAQPNATVPPQGGGDGGPPQADAIQPPSPTHAAPDRQAWLAMLDETIGQLRRAVERSGQEPAANAQGAMTPARMDLKAAAQQAHDTLRRAPQALQGTPPVQNAARDVRDELAKLSQPTRLEDSDGAASRILARMEALRGELGS
ncbi:hypothetical protein [Pseudoroseomonas cervicalis]|uniref:hypothetical protein n=1 Tax=Teichococcus cervicalis TaxID=204525 RepID=UPI0022F1559D|nr:hypothetical protein [Pseudoroseomonas cervicalis]WBV44837.1 hypothetical protein PFY06_18900 [Pseudoroseomonas cervicalis]